MEFIRTKKIYILTMFFMGLTGFAQMPIFKRYYIADLPGLGWLADFYATHTMHYIGAAFLLAFFTYLAVDFRLDLRLHYRLTHAARIRLVLLLCIVISGIFRVLKNMPNILFSPEFTMFIDISHLGFMMLLMASSIIFSFRQQGWLKSMNRNGS